MGATKHTVKPTTSQRVTELHGFGTDSVRVLMEDVMTAKLHLSSQTYVALWLSLSPLSLWIIRMNRWCLIFIYLFFQFGILQLRNRKTENKITGLSLLPPQKRLFFTPAGLFVCLMVGLLVCQHDYTKITECIYTKLGWRMGLSSEQTLGTFGVDPGEGTDPGACFSLSLWQVTLIFWEFCGSVCGVFPQTFLTG